MRDHYLKYIDSLLEDKEQIRAHRKDVAYIIIIFTIIMYTSFIVLICAGNTIKELIATSPYSIILIALLAIVPTTLLVLLVGGLYKIKTSVNGIPVNDAFQHLGTVINPQKTVQSDSLAENLDSLIKE